MTSEQKQIIELTDKVDKLELLVRILLKENESIKVLEAKVKSLEFEVTTLKEENELLRHSKNSTNSSIPPSKDENRPFKTKSLRTSDGKKPGGQKGHPGSTLKMVENPDVIIEHKPSSCINCGLSLEGSASELLARKQIVDIPPIVPQYTEHRIFKSICTCGAHTMSFFPAGVNAPISYGPNVEAIIAYSHAFQYIPVQRMSEQFSNIFNLPISCGAICDILDRFAKKAKPTYLQIAKNLENSTVVGADETGAKVNGKLGWFWTWQNHLATFIAFSSNRGFATIKENFAQGFHKAILVHDCWKSHFDTNVKSHQICIAHLLRELNYLEEIHYNDWPTKFKQLLYDALDLKRSLTPLQYTDKVIQRTQLEERLIKLLESDIPVKLKDIRTFQKRLVKYKNYIFPFLYYADVPPDNNGSERAIRNVKVKLKVSGQFKTSIGAQSYAIIRSIIDTCIKTDQNILLTFRDIALAQPE